MSTPTALVTLAGLAVLEGELDLPLQGVWQFTGEVDLAGDPPPDLPSGLVVLSFAREGQDPVEFVGTVRDAAEWQGRAAIRIVGGAGGLEGPLPGQGYAAHPVPVALAELLVDLAELTGETLADDALTYGADVPMGRWSRRGSGRAVLDALAAEADATWRVLSDGTLWVGVDAWTEATPADVYQQGDEGVDGVIQIAPDGPTIVPGTTVLGQQITRVVYRITADGIRAELHYHAGELGELESAVRRVLPELDYLPPLEGTVTQVAGDGNLQVQTDEAGTLDRVTLLVGASGMAVTARAGDRVRIFYSAADPAKYFALGLEQDASADKGVAREGDEVFLGHLSATCASPGSPAALLITPAPVAGSIPLKGTITKGHPRVKLTAEGQ